MRTPVSLGVAGLGQWGAEIARAFDDSPLADVRWVYDERTAAGGPRRRLGGVLPDARGPHDLIARQTLDPVGIAAPPAARARLARTALEADKHVYVEGP